MKKLFIICAVVLTVGLPGMASEKSIHLPPDNAMANLQAGPGVEAARVNCVPCHSTDYIVRQPRGDAKHWGAEVKKMITVFGAPISDEDAKKITEYLSTAYGVEAQPVAGSGGKPKPARKSEKGKKR